MKVSQPLPYRQAERLLQVSSNCHYDSNQPGNQQAHFRKCKSEGLVFGLFFVLSVEKGFILLLLEERGCWLLLLEDLIWRSAFFVASMALK
jgi:hypothetical protein